jgi:hypothetical protein
MSLFNEGLGMRNIEGIEKNLEGVRDNAIQKTSSPRVVEPDINFIKGNSYKSLVAINNARCKNNTSR